MHLEHKFFLTATVNANGDELVLQFWSFGNGFLSRVQSADYADGRIDRLSITGIYFEGYMAAGDANGGLRLIVWRLNPFTGGIGRLDDSGALGAPDLSLFTGWDKGLLRLLLMLTEI